MTEAELQKAILDAARQFGWLVYHTHDSRRSQAGFPDLVMVKGSRIIFAELKAEKGRLSPAQLTWINALQNTYAEVYVWRPESLEAAYKHLAPVSAQF